MRPIPRYQPGDRIGGRYQVHQVKMGGMGEVYLCLDLQENYPYALKTFQQRYQSTALRNANRVSAMVDELFELAKLEAEGAKPNLEAFALDDLVQDVIHQQALAGVSRGIDFRVVETTGLQTPLLLDAKRKSYAAVQAHRGKTSVLHPMGILRAARAWLRRELS